MKNTSCRTALDVMRHFRTVTQPVDGWTITGHTNFTFSGRKGAARFYCDVFGVD